MKKTQLLKELREAKAESLSKEIVELNHKMSKLKLDAAMSRLKNVKEIKHTRTRIARIWTVLNERAISEVEKRG